MLVFQKLGMLYTWSSIQCSLQHSITYVIAATLVSFRRIGHLLVNNEIAVNFSSSSVSIDCGKWETSFYFRGDRHIFWLNLAPLLWPFAFAKVMSINYSFQNSTSYFIVWFRRRTVYVPKALPNTSQFVPLFSSSRR